MQTKALIRFSIPTVIVAAILIFMQPSIVPGGAGVPESITDIVWEWEGTRYNNDQETAPPDPSHYTITFKPGGIVQVRADCNRAGGTYTLQDKRITIQVTHSTRAMCPPESLDQNFLKDLDAAAIVFFKDGNLYLDLKYDSGTMKFGQ